MAVELYKNPKVILQSAGISAALIDKLSSAGIKVTPLFGKLSFVKDGETLSSVAIPTNVITAMAGGKKLPSAYSKVKAALVKAIKVAGVYDEGEDFEDEVVDEGEEWVVATAIEGEIKKSTTTAPKEKHEVSLADLLLGAGSVVGEGSEGKPGGSQKPKIDAGVSIDLTQTPVKLASATALYTPVLATSAGSVYFLVGSNGGGIAIGARYKKGKLSVRVEGSELMSKSAELKALNIDTSNLPGYASIHVGVGSHVEATMAVGAINAVLLGGKAMTGAPEMSFIYEKGH